MKGELPVDLRLLRATVAQAKLDKSNAYRDWCGAKAELELAAERFDWCAGNVVRLEAELRAAEAGLLALQGSETDG